MNQDTNSTPSRRGVLVVDDEPQVLAVVEEILSARGFRAYTATSTTTALEVIDAASPSSVDVVVTDLNLGRASGLDLIAAIRDRSISIPVIVFSGAASVETAAGALRLGVSDFLVKPVTGQQLVESVRRVLERYDAERVIERERMTVVTQLDTLRTEVDVRTQELTLASDRYRELVESLNVLVYELDVETELLTHLGGPLAQRVVHRTITSDAPLSLSELIHPDELTWVRELLTKRARIRDVSPEPLEFRLLTHDDDELWVRWIPSRGRAHESSRLTAGMLVDVSAEHAARAARVRVEVALASAREELDRRLLRDLDSSGRRDDSLPPPAVSASVAAAVAEPEFGTSPSMARARSAALLAAEHDEPVLVLGETGTGKGMLADFIHRHCRRSKASFVALNCASLGGDLLASELFGHTRGAFTSADKTRKGLIEEAEGGTLFLDEIGEMGREVQGQLLKVLEEKTYRRVGESTPRKSNFRLICATHRDLREMATLGSFRSDLLYRIDVFRISMPALRERPEDILPLARKMLARAGASDVQISAETERFLERLPWRGNVRELRSAIIRASLLARGGPLRPEHFEDFVSVEGPATAAPSQIGLRPPSQEKPRPQHDVHGDADSPEDEQRIRELLARFDGNRAKVARAMGIARSTLYRKLERLGL